MKWALLIAMQCALILRNNETMTNTIFFSIKHVSHLHLCVEQVLGAIWNVISKRFIHMILVLNERVYLCDDCSTLCERKLKNLRQQGVLM